MRRTSLPPPLSLFQPIEWFQHTRPNYYINHLIKELGRLGLDIYDLGTRADSDSVLGDLIDWISDRGNEAYLYDWQKLNLPLLLERATEREYTRIKPRIQIYAHVTARDNLSVLWYPTGWQESWNAERRRQLCDFLFFEDEGRQFERPRNELMFIHGVGNLRPKQGTENYGPYTRYNKPVVDGILICAVRAAYELLISHLEQNFEVTVRTVFEFEENSRQVIGWSLEDPEVLQHRKDQQELDVIETTFGFTVELFDEQTRLASLPRQGSEEEPSFYSVNQKLAKNLTKIGKKITPSQVERLRNLINRYRSYNRDNHG